MEKVKLPPLEIKEGTELEIAFCHGWDEILPLIVIPESVWNEFDAIFGPGQGTPLNLLNRPVEPPSEDDRAMLKQKAFDFGVKSARTFQNPDLTL